MKKVVIVLVAIIGVLVIALGVFLGTFLLFDKYFPFKVEKNKFQYSSDMPYTDPYGLTNRNNILGENISDVLATYNGYTTDDYTLAADDYLAIYTFHDSVSDYPAGWLEDVKLTLVAENNIVVLVEYRGRHTDFETTNSVGIRSNMIEYINRCRQELVDALDVDPVYLYEDEDGNETQLEGFEWSFDKGAQSIYYFGEDFMAVVEAQNYYNEKKEEFSISFYLN